MIHKEDWKPSAGLTLEPNAKAAATSEQGSVAIMAGPGAGKTEMLAQRADFLLRTGVCKYPKRILAISFKKDASENLKERVRKRCGTELASRFDSFTFHAFSKRIINIFRPFLDEVDQLDENYRIGEPRKPRIQITYNDLIPLANKIVMKCPTAKNSLRQTYGDVFLDEFQDCTTIQYSLIKNAFHKLPARVIAVGDTKQKLMGWAGALEGIFLNFENDFDAISYNLYQNFRSLPRIRRIHNSMIKDIDFKSAVDEREIQGEGGKVSIERFSDEEEEAIWIADSIAKWTREGLPLGEIAVLCKTQPHLYASFLMEELGRRNIPFRNEQEMQDLSCEPIFKVIVDYLVVLLGTSEPDSWERLFSVLSPVHFDDKDDIKARGWNQFIRQQRFIVNGSNDVRAIWLAVKELIKTLGNDRIIAMSNDYETKERFDEIVGFTKAQVENCFRRSSSIVESLKELSAINAVRILTITKCKGLEFETVIVQGVENETFFGKKEDNECAYFVAISRAKQSLIITISAHRTKLPGANNYWQEARTPHERFIGYVETQLEDL